MPAIAKVTKEMIIDAAFETVKEMGAENINARTVSQKLGCSTQPVLYHFKTIEDVRIATYKKASEFHINYVTNLSGKYERPMLEVGMRYIQFAVEEKNLFRFLYHSNYYTGVSLSDWLTGKIFDSLFPILKRQARVGNCPGGYVFCPQFFCNFKSSFYNNFFCDFCDCRHILTSIYNSHYV